LGISWARALEENITAANDAARAKLVLILGMAKTTTGSKRSLAQPNRV
jgi:hypothetical protein